MPEFVYRSPLVHTCADTHQALQKPEVQVQLVTVPLSGSLLWSFLVSGLLYLFTQAPLHLSFSEPGLCQAQGLTVQTFGWRRANVLPQFLVAEQAASKEECTLKEVSSRFPLLSSTLVTLNKGAVHSLPRDV